MLTWQLGKKQERKGRGKKRTQEEATSEPVISEEERKAARLAKVSHGIGRIR